MKKLFFILLIFAVLTACGAEKETAHENESVPPAETVQEDTPSKPGTGLFWRSSIRPTTRP